MDRLVWVTNLFVLLTLAFFLTATPEPLLVKGRCPVKPEEEEGTEAAPDGVGVVAMAVEDG